MSDANSSGDSNELEALFDSIAGGGASASISAAPAPAPKTPAPSAAAPKSSLMQQAREVDGATDDSKDLQALFDSIAAKKSAADNSAAGIEEGAGEESGDWPVQDKVFNQVGQMARQLHDTLGSLGYEKLLEKTASALPDAKVLNATDIANPLQEELEAGAALLSAKWDTLFANNMGVEDFKLLAAETRAFLKTAVPQRTGATKEQLLEIMMAQDFQDLTGQVIKKVVAVAQDLESQLMQVLVVTMPGEKRTESVNTLLNGPVINAEGRTDVVGSQQQVDSLLDSLGF